MKRISRLVLYLASAWSLVAIANSQNECTEQERLLAADCDNCPRGNDLDCNCTRASPPELQVSNIADRSATLRWDPSGISSFAGYSIIYYFVGGDREVLCIDDRMTSSVMLTTLRPFTAYSVLIRPSCDDGYGLCSTRVTSFTTTGAAPSGRPQNVRVSKVRNTASQYQVSWDPPPNGTWNGPTLQHRITIINQTDNSMMSYNVTAGTTVYVVCMLESGDYLVRVRAYNIYGQGPDSDTEVFSITSNTTTAIPTPTTITAAIASTTVTIFATPTSSSTPTTPISSSSSSSFNAGLILGVLLAIVFVTTVIIIILVIVIVVWKRNRNGSTKPEGVYYSTIGERTVQTSIPNKPEPLYTETDDEQIITETDDEQVIPMNTSNANPTMQNNPAYSDPKEQVVLQNNPAYCCVINDQVKLQDNPAYCGVINDQVKLQDNPAYVSTSSYKLKE
ncbi:mucin-2-like isoform X2 [Dysidea avara]|uniref:mucin-2-like isoform X2 n=1 Tax=Dysidea avara TaxID=196820 RepID=UPI003324508F